MSVDLLALRVDLNQEDARRVQDGAVGADVHAVGGTNASARLLEVDLGIFFGEGLGERFVVAELLEERFVGVVLGELDEALRPYELPVGVHVLVAYFRLRRFDLDMGVAIFRVGEADHSSWHRRSSLTSC